MKQTLKLSLYAILPLLFFGLVYLIFSFYNVDMNMNNWDEKVRGVCSLCGSIMFMAGILMAYEINNN